MANFINILSNIKKDIDDLNNCIENVSILNETDKYIRNIKRLLTHKLLEKYTFNHCVDIISIDMNSDTDGIDMEIVTDYFTNEGVLVKKCKSPYGGECIRFILDFNNEEN